MASGFELVLRPRRGWQPIDWQEAWHYRELLAFLVWRDIKIRYRQTVLGGLWAVLQPLVAMAIFTIFFNRLVGIGTEGAPYPLFAFSGLVAWTFFANSVVTASNSLIGNQQLISKVYFPRVFITLGSIGAFVLDMLLGLLLMVPLMFWYRWPPSWNLLLLPLFMLGTGAAACGLGLVFAALNVRFRDVKYAVPFLVQMIFFITPVIYPIRYVPERWRFLLAINPMAGLVMGFRYALLGNPISWSVVGISLAVSATLLLLGLVVFRRMEYFFADMI